MPVRRLLCRCPRRCHGLRRHRHRRPPRYPRPFRRLGRLPRRRQCRHLARRRLVMVECGALSGRALWPLVATVVCRVGPGVLVGLCWLLPESWCGGWCGVGIAAARTTRSIPVTLNDLFYRRWMHIRYLGARERLAQQKGRVVRMTIKAMRWVSGGVAAAMAASGLACLHGPMMMVWSRFRRLWRTSGMRAGVTRVRRATRFSLISRPWIRRIAAI